MLSDSLRTGSTALLTALMRSYFLTAMTAMMTAIEKHFKNNKKPLKQSMALKFGLNKGFIKVTRVSIFFETLVLLVQVTGLEPARFPTRS